MQKSKTFLNKNGQQMPAFLKTAQIVHEIKQPLAAMTMLAELSLHDLNEPVAEEDIENLRAYLGEIIEQGRFCSRIIERMQNLSEVEDLTFEPMDVKSVLRQVLKEIKYHEKREELTIRENMQDTTPVIYADKDALHQVFTNIVTNAVDAMQNSQEKILSVNCYSVEQGICIEIRDTGKGIEESKVDKIFESRYTTKGDEGSGLGLSITKSIVDAHSGRIAVKSKINTGTAFSIFFPIRRR